MQSKEKKAVYNKKYREAHREDSKKYREAHKEEIVKYGKKYYGAHKEEITERKKKYSENHRDEVAAYNKGYKEAHREELVAHRKEYYQTEKGKAASRKGNHKRRATKAGVVCQIFNTSAVFERDGYICQNCGRKTRPDFKNPNHPLYPNLDHIVPLSKGGAHTKINTQCLCHQCNMFKNNTGVGDQLRMFG